MAITCRRTLEKIKICPNKDLRNCRVRMQISKAMFTGNENGSANIDYNTIISENKNELLGIILDSKLFLKITYTTSVKKQRISKIQRITKSCSIHVF